MFGVGGLGCDVGLGPGQKHQEVGGECVLLGLRELGQLLSSDGLRLLGLTAPQRYQHPGRGQFTLVLGAEGQCLYAGQHAGHATGSIVQATRANVHKAQLFLQKPPVDRRHRVDAGVRHDRLHLGRTPKADDGFDDVAPEYVVDPHVRRPELCEHVQVGHPYGYDPFQIAQLQEGIGFADTHRGQQFPMLHVGSQPPRFCVGSEALLHMTFR